MSLLTRLNVPNARVKDERFYVLMETHLPYLRQHSSTRVIEVTGQQGDMYCGDLYGLLDLLSIDKKYHYLIMRVNDIVSSSDYDGEKLSFLVPDPSVVASIFSTYGSRED